MKFVGGLAQGLLQKPGWPRDIFTACESLRLNARLSIWRYTISQSACSSGTSNLHCEFDAAIGELLLSNRVTPPASLDSSLLHRVTLQKRVKFLLRAPASCEVVKVDVPCVHVNHHGVAPVRQLHLPTRLRAAKQSRLTEDRLRQTRRLQAVHEWRPDHGLLFEFERCATRTVSFRMGDLEAEGLRSNKKTPQPPEDFGRNGAERGCFSRVPRLRRWHPLT